MKKSLVVHFSSWIADLRFMDSRVLGIIRVAKDAGYQVTKEDVQIALMEVNGVMGYELKVSIPVS